MARTRQRIFTGTVIRSPMKKTTGEGKGADTVPLKRREAALTHAQHEPDGDEDEGRGGGSEAVLGVADYTSVFLDMLGELHLSTSADDWTVEHTLHESNTSPGGKARVLLRHTGDPATAFFSYTSAIKAVAARKNACSPAASHAMQAVVRKHVAMARTRVPLVPSSPEAEATLKRLGVPTTTIAADAGAGAGASAAVPSPSSPSSLSPSSFSASASASSGPCSSWEDIREALPLPSPPLLFDDVSDADIDSLLQYICACECK